MEVEGLDPRQVRTRCALLSAAIELVDERDTAEISVTDLAARAGVTRKSLYLNFLDRDALLQAAGVYRYERALNEYHRSGAGGLVGTADKVFRHVREHRDFYRRLLSGTCGVETYRAIQRFLAQGIGRAALQQGVLLEETDRLFLSGGAMALLVASLDSDRPSSAPAEARGLVVLLTRYLAAHALDRAHMAQNQPSEINELGSSR